MTLELVIELISSLLGTGGIITIFLIAEKKAAAQLQNAEKIQEEWRLIVSQKEHDLSLLNTKYEAATAKIERLYDDNSELRNKLDIVNTDCAVSKIMRCDNISCANRKPPFASLENLKLLQINDKPDI